MKAIPVRLHKTPSQHIFSKFGRRDGRREARLRRRSPTRESEVGSTKSRLHCSLRRATATEDFFMKRVKQILPCGLVRL